MTIQPTITINRDPAAAAAAMAAAVGGKGQPQDTGRVARQKLAAKAREEAASGNFAGGPETKPADQEIPPPREDIDSLKFTLPSGHVVEFGPPVGVSLTVKMLAIFGSQDFSAPQERCTWVMCCLRSVDGVAVRISNLVDRDKWMQVIGDESYGVLAWALNKYWPPLRKFDLDIIEKKMR